LVGRSSLGSTNSRARPSDDKGVLEAVRVGLCCRRAHADSGGFGRRDRRFRVLEPSCRSQLPGSFEALGLRRPRNGASCEDLTPARCARPFVWLQKSSSGVRSRRASLVAASGAHGDSASGSKTAKNGSQRRKGVERTDRVATPGRSKGPEKGSLLAEDVRCCGNRRRSRGGSRSGIGPKEDPARSPGTPEGDTGVRGRTPTPWILTLRPSDPGGDSRPEARPTP
jgi:hypothetical protein